MDKKPEKNRHVIVSDKVRHRIGLDKEISYNTIHSKNLEKDIAKLIGDGSLIFMIIFMAVEDLERIDSFFMEKYDSPVVFYRLVVFGEEGELSNITPNLLHRVSELRVAPISFTEFNLIIEKTLLQIGRLYKHHRQMDSDMERLIDMKRDQEDLINIGRSLSTEKDFNELIKLILHLSKKITGADAGSIYIVEQPEDADKRLRFKYSHTFSRDLPMEEFTLEINKNSIAGYVATTGEVLNIPDAYRLSPDSPVSFNTSFDETNDYKSRSMLVVPMKNHIDEIIGVIQLINSKENTKDGRSITGNEAFEIMLESPEDFDELVVPFDDRYEGLMESVAGQAAIAIENNRMIEQIQDQFEEFVRASVTAVESRDIATSGHSFRVAEICTAMAYAINKEKKGPFKGVAFTANEIKEIEYAALLHDFGKVYVDLNIFKKAKKLFPKDFSNLCLRLNYLYRFLELYYITRNGKTPQPGGACQSEIHSDSKEVSLGYIKEIKSILQELNEPTITEESPKDILNKVMTHIEKIECEDIEGNRIEIITEFERKNLEIERGSLNEEERKEIESHVIHAYNFVSRIPWPPEFKKIPEIILCHHEKLDGTGYPNGTEGDDLTIQARIMAIADIYDALVAADRPYKKAMEVDRALDILKQEVERNKLDKDLFKIFINYKIYEKITKQPPSI